METMYKNKLEHDMYGELWYKITLRNWNGFGISREENLESGPCFEIFLVDHNVMAYGASLDACLASMHRTLDAHAIKNMTLPEPAKPISWREKWRLNRMFKRWARDGHTDPV
jgi:hypothetical protein